MCAVSSPGKPPRITACHAAFGGHAVHPEIASRNGEAGGIAGHVIAVNQTEIKLDFRPQLQAGERCVVGVVVAWFGHISLAASRCPTPKRCFRTLAAATGSHLKRLPDGETGIRKTSIRFLQQVLADNPGIDVASDVPAFKFTQWDGKLLREIPRLRP